MNHKQTGVAAPADVATAYLAAVGEFTAPLR